MLVEIRWNLSSQPVSLFNNEGLMNTANKPDLAEAFTEITKKPMPTLPTSNALQWKKNETFRQISQHYVNHVNRNFFVAVKLIKYIFSAVKECSPNPCVGPISNINVFSLIINMWGRIHICSKKLLHFDHIHHLEMKIFLFYQTQFHDLNSYTYQYQHF